MLLTARFVMQKQFKQSFDKNDISICTCQSHITIVFNRTFLLRDFNVAAPIWFYQQRLRWSTFGKHNKSTCSDTKFQRPI
ncbi:unnamed protein product, partial [Rotaria magnacalcarata]